MKRFKQVLIAVFLVFFCITIAWAVSTFTWNANTESDLEGYHLYRSPTSGQYTFGSNWVADIPAGTETIDYTAPEGTWYFVLTAYDTSGNESGPSNEVTLVVPDTTPPADPNGLQCSGPSQ